MSKHRVGRIQALGKTNDPEDIYDVRIQSPKSAMLSQEGKKLYINALEGGQMLVFSFPDGDVAQRQIPLGAVLPPQL